MIFQLNITDINDQKPLFNRNYTFDILENNRVPTVLGQVNAYDADQGVNGQVIYSLSPTSLEFSILPADGTILVNRSLDYELQREYQFKVHARDSGQPPLESFTYVQVNVLNQNEHPPVFENDLYLFSLYENSTNETRSLVGHVNAVDQDYGDTVSYSLDNHQDLFTIDELGNIWTEIAFDREVHDQYNLTVFATDNATIGSTIVRIEIK